MKFEAEDPAEVSKAGSGGVDRSQGAARAISVRSHYYFVVPFCLHQIASTVFHRSWLELGGP